MNFNKAVLIGRVCKEIESKQTPTGKTVVSFSLATNKTYTKDGKKVENVEFHNIVAWNKIAEIIKQWVVKGQLLMVEGSIQTRNWEDKKAGVKRYRTEIVVDNMQMGPKPRGAEGTPQSSTGEGEQPDPSKESEINVENIPF